MNQRENTSTKANDEGREEGEIVDSDEEQNILRQRIKELEARNDELEKIDELGKITSDYTNQYRYATDLPYRNRTLHSNVKQTFMSQKDVARIPSDASSISSDEMIPTVRKRTKRKGRHSKKEKEHCKKCRSRSSSLHKHNHRSHKSESKLIKSEEYCRKHNKLRLHKMKLPLVVNENYLETISLDSDEDSEPQKVDESNSDYEDGKSSSLYLNRDELRFALARDRTNETKTTGNLLKERLYNGNVLLDHKENINTCDIVATNSLDAIKSENTFKSHVSEQSPENSDKDECATQEEQELRLIALKSAILKKHLARKKRNAEMAYSPTDFAPVPANPVIADDNMDVVEEELDELNDVMEISPINSPKLALTPSNDGDLNHFDFKVAGDNNSIDMDIAQSESEDEISNNKNDQWYPIETAPMTAQSVKSNESLKYPLPVHYGIYVPEMQYQLAPPNMINKPSELIDNVEQLTHPGMNMYANFIYDDEPPPPPSMYFTISDDDEEPPPPPSTLDTFSNIFADMKFDEEPPPPPSFFPENGSNSTKNNIFQRLGTKTEGNSNDFLFNVMEAHPLKINQVDVEEEEDKDSDEEASALRAILLSKLQASKSQKKEHTVKKVSQQFLPNLEIVCHTEEKPDRNGIETVLQKALKRLKSSSSSLKEDDAKAVRVKENCINAVTKTVEVVNLNSDMEENKKLSTKSLPTLEKKTGSIRNRLMKKIKNIASKHASNLDKNSPARPSSVPNIVPDLSDFQEKDSDSCPSITTGQRIEHHENSSEVFKDSITETDTNDASFNRSDVTAVAEQIENGIKSNTLCGENKIDNTPNKTIETTKEIQEDSLKQKSKQVKSPISKNSTLNNNSKTEESTSKQKKLNPVALQTATASVQPLSVKNNLIPSGISTLKSAQKVLQSTLEKVRTTRTTKIIRPNKIINKEITTNIKRAMTPSHSPTPPSKIQRTSLNTSAKTIKSTLSSSDVPPKITVKKLIINLRASDTESSDNELMKEVLVPVHRVKNGYNEIASPLELFMDSCSPAGSINSISNETPTSTKVIKSMNAPATTAAFEKKLDAFLKGIRKKGSLESSSNQSTKCAPITRNEIAKNLNTPSAVRHLPLASQDEYRRLVHRMKLLEKQKQSKKPDEDAAAKISTLANIPEATNNTAQIEEKNEVAEEHAKNVIKKNIQLKKLLLYENSFEQTSDNIVRLLNKSLSLVAEAKKAKIAKLRHEQKLQEIRAEMARLQALFELEERMFSSMKPQIGASNQFLTSLKKKRRNLMDNANKLGKSLKGDEYRLDNKTGGEIIAKSRKLHAEIKFVNSLKTDNIDKFLLLHSNSSKEISDSTINGATVQSDLFTEIRTAANCIQVASLQTALGDVGTNETEKKSDCEVAKESEECSIEKIPITKHQNCHDQCSNQIEKVPENTADINSGNKFSDIAETVENEMRVELEVQHEDQITEEVSDQHPNKNSNFESVVPMYISPLDHFRHEYRNIDVNAIVCPYEMWGKCADESCSYMHMTIGKKRGTELAFTPLNAENRV